MVNPYRRYGFFSFNGTTNKSLYGYYTFSLLICAFSPRILYAVRYGAPYISIHPYGVRLSCFQYFVLLFRIQCFCFSFVQLVNFFAHREFCRSVTDGSYKESNSTFAIFSFVLALSLFSDVILSTKYVILSNMLYRTLLISPKNMIKTIFRTMFESST